MFKTGWRQSEIDVENMYPSYESQKSLLDGGEVTYGTLGSSRPKLYRPGSSIEVKNYNITNSSGRSNLVNNITKQYNQRLNNLPQGTSQTIIIDVREQTVTDSILDSIYTKLFEKTGGDIVIKFIT